MSQIPSGPLVLNFTVPPPVGSGSLATICNNLAVGASIQFPAGQQSALTQAETAWQSIFCHDALHNICHLIGKEAGGPTVPWYHTIYNMSTSVWSSKVLIGLLGTGHVYGDLTIDPATGDLWLDASGNRLEHWTYATQSWSRTASPMWSGAVNLPSNGAGWHPNLFGTGIGGVVVNSETNGANSGIVYYRPSNATYTQQNTSIALGTNTGQSIYLPGVNKQILGGTRHALITPGTPPSFVDVGAPPVPTQGYSYSSGATFGTMLVHPGNPNKVLLLEFVPGKRMWFTTDGDNWTQGPDHPFLPQPATDLARILCSLAGGLGCIWMIGRTSGGNFSMVWKPAL